MNKDKIIKLTQELIEILKRGDVGLTDDGRYSSDLTTAIDILSALEEEFDE